MTFGQYSESLVLFTDFYQLTMAQGYWAEIEKNEGREQNTSFELYFRNNPFDGGYAVSCGLQDVIKYINKFKFTETIIAYLRTKIDSEGLPLFHEGFLDYLRTLKFSCDIDAMPNGTVVFANEPLIRVTGPNIQAQLIETALLNIMNFQTLIATKAARIKYACKNKHLADFGLRRAQEQGALSASYAAYIGGTDSTSNVGAEFNFGIPCTGTHAHSWIMTHKDELTAFRKYAEMMPGNCVFLVDTFDVMEGTKNALIVAKELRLLGHEIIGVRIDSGDLAHLSIQIRDLLDKSGFPNAKIIASNDLDEHVISSLNAQGAKIDIWGVGTRLLTAFQQPALGGVYKLGAVQRSDGSWQPKIKLATPEKTTTPGRRQVRRYYRLETDTDGKDHQKFIADAIYDIDNPPNGPFKVVHPHDRSTKTTLSLNMLYNDLLTPIYREGNLIYIEPSIHESKDRAKAQLHALNERTKRLLNPEIYMAGLDESLDLIKFSLIHTLKDKTLMHGS